MCAEYDKIMNVFLSCGTSRTTREVLGVLGFHELQVLCRHYAVGVGGLEKVLVNDLVLKGFIVAEKMEFGEALDYTHLSHNFPDGVGTRCGFLDSRLAITDVKESVDCPVCLKLSADVETEKPVETEKISAPVVEAGVKGLGLLEVDLLRKELEFMQRNLDVVQRGITLAMGRLPEVVI